MFQKSLYFRLYGAKSYKKFKYMQVLTDFDAWIENQRT